LNLIFHHQRNLILFIVF